MSGPEITVELRGDETVCQLTGRLVTNALQDVETRFKEVAGQTGVARLDLSELEALDTGGAHLIVQLQDRLSKAGTLVEVSGASSDMIVLLEKVRTSGFDMVQVETRAVAVSDRLASVGHRVVDARKHVASFLNFLGLVIARLLRTIVNPIRLRGTALVAQMQQTGYNAVPIIALMGFLIGIVLAYQGAAQLRQFGAEVFVVDLIAVSVLRELGILLTAIIVAGRSGSAYSAAIGSMKVNEEIDAMQTLGLDPIEVLVLPRLIALVVMLPVLGLIANLSALFGGALMSWVELNVSPGMFVTRFWENTSVWHLIVGMIKAPVFAFIIAIVACWQGLQVGGSAESVGQRTTASVVQAIFLVIVMDAVFSIFFAELGV